VMLQENRKNNRRIARTTRESEDIGSGKEKRKQSSTVEWILITLTEDDNEITTFEPEA
jgi:hypothetical protein